MGKHRGQQEKSRGGREKKRKLLKAKLRLSDKEGLGVVPRRSKAPNAVTYSKEHSILICGDGDFSFTRGVIRQRGTGIGVVATSLDSRQAVLTKYPRAKHWLPELETMGAQVIHSVDATRLKNSLLAATRVGKSKERSRGFFDRVVFNFPHTGVQRVHLNRNLIRDFFGSTRDLVKCADVGGEVHVTLKDKPPYSGWNVKAMAEEGNLVMLRTLVFDPTLFPGYHHSTTDPRAKEFKADGAKTHVFARARSGVDDEANTSGDFPILAPLEQAPLNGKGPQAPPRRVSPTGPGTGDSDEEAQGEELHYLGREVESPVGAGDPTRVARGREEPKGIPVKRKAAKRREARKRAAARAAAEKATNEGGRPEPQVGLRGVPQDLGGAEARLGKHL
ncbi:unnamed protein product [Discosporangium mesarthrocarpum]